MATHPNKKSDYKLAEFFKVFFQGDFEDLIVFLEEHGGIDCVEEYRRTAFINCVIQSGVQSTTDRDKKNIDRAKDYAKRLIDSGCDVSLKDKAEWSALDFAKRDNNVEILDLLQRLDG